MHSLKKGFTLVELIVVITILAILWTIAFISLQWYAANARDSVRIQDIANIKKSMELFVTESWLYPNPSDSVDITYSWWIVWSQWTVWDSVVENLWKLNKKPVDPVLATEYSYSRTNNKTEYELSGILEWWWVVNNTTINQTHAATQYRALVWWNYNGQVLKVSTWWLDYLLALPSITTTDTATTDIVTTTTNKSLVYNGEYNLPSNYSWVEWFTTTWWFEYAPSDIVAFSWPREELELASGKIKFIRNLQTAYSWSILSLKSEFTELLSFDAQTDVDTAREIALWMFQNVPQFNKNLQSTTFEPSFVWWLQLWLDADADYTITKDGSNKVSQWNDKSGNENHATQWTSNDQPTYSTSGMNGKPTFSFDGAGDTFDISNNISLTNDYEIFIIAESTWLETWVSFILGSSSTNTKLGKQQNNKIFARVINGGAFDISVDFPSKNTPFLENFTRNSNNKIDVSFNNAGFNRLFSGAEQSGSTTFNKIGVDDLLVQNNYWEGKISEILIYNKALSASERNKVISYLAKKWWIGISAFHPDNFSDLTIWLDASDTSTITKDGSNRVSQWDDKSTNGYNVTQTITSGKPATNASTMNGLNVITFDGVVNSLENLSADNLAQRDELSYFIVMERDSYVFNSSSFTMWQDGQAHDYNNVESIMGAYEYYTDFGYVRLEQGNPILLTEHPGDEVPFIYSTIFDGMSNNSYINGDGSLFANPTVNSTTSGNFDLNNIRLGKRFTNAAYWKGNIAEIIVYSKALSTYEREAVESYLKSKWWI